MGAGSGGFSGPASPRSCARQGAPPQRVTVLVRLDASVAESQKSLRREKENVPRAGSRDLVLGALEQEDGARERVDGPDRRAGLIDGLVLGVAAHEPVQIPRFELVRVAREHLEVADAVLGAARREDVAEGQGAQGGVAARLKTNLQRTSRDHKILTEPPSMASRLGSARPLSAR